MEVRSITYIDKAGNEITEMVDMDVYRMSGRPEDNGAIVEFLKECRTMAGVLFEYTRSDGE